MVYENILCPNLDKQYYFLQERTGSVSTGSGISDFRRPGNELREKVNPSEVTSINAFYENHQQFYCFYRAQIEMLFKVSPNPVHKAIAQLEVMGFVKYLSLTTLDIYIQKPDQKELLKFAVLQMKLFVENYQKDAEIHKRVMANLIWRKLPTCKSGDQSNFLYLILRWFFNIMKI